MYKGNTNDPEKKADDYMEKYGMYVFRKKAANMERLEGGSHNHGGMHRRIRSRLGSVGTRRP